MLVNRKSYARKPVVSRVKYVLSAFDYLDGAVELLLQSRLGNQDREFVLARQGELLDLRASFENNLIDRYKHKMTHFL